MNSQLKRIDYVLVLDKDILEIEDEVESIVKFINFLEERGLEIEFTRGMMFEVIFVKIHLTQAALDHYAQAYNIDIYNSGHNFIPGFQIKLKRFNTVLTMKHNDLFTRQGEATTAERIMILNEILETSKFGSQLYGLKKMLRLGFIKTAYPLHDGDYRLQDNKKPVNDRQLLSEYWAKFGLWYTEQPLNLIAKYYGTEVAFYFAWVGFYNFMLIPATIIGVLCFFAGLIQLASGEINRVNEICNSNQIMCPVCHGKSKCLYTPLSNSCFYTKLTFLFDNYLTICFAIFMSFWATLFLNLWKRRENMLKIRWNVEVMDFDTKMRSEFYENTSHRKVNHATKKLEPYVPKMVAVKYFSLTIAVCTLSVFVVILVIFGIITYRITISGMIKASNHKILKRQVTFFTMCTGSIMQVIFIAIFSKFYGKASLWLTALENPRTQSEFDKSVIYKRFFLGFTNNYCPLFYIAFLKGHFFTTPHHVGLLANDICQPAGCITALCIQLSFIIVLKSLVGNVITFVRNHIPKRCRKKDHLELEQWEQEYELKECNRYFLIAEQMTMIMQYGFVTLFVAAFPLAPLCALLNNVVELRSDAYKLIRHYRRPVPRKLSGIGPFNGILRGITYLSTATNAFVWAFTSDFVAREIYKYQVDSSLKGFINSTLSVFDPHNFSLGKRQALRANDLNVTLCYYRGNRYPPNHPRKYQLTTNFWYEMGIRLICVLIFEHFIFIFNGMLAYSIQDIPRSIRKYLHHQRHLHKELKTQIRKNDLNQDEDFKELETKKV